MAKFTSRRSFWARHRRLRAWLVWVPGGLVAIVLLVWAAFQVSPWPSGLLVRVFIIFHDCGHGSFFKSRVANDVLGIITGVLCFTPYYRWRWEHAVHHGSSGDLDRRGTGDVWTLNGQKLWSTSAPIWPGFATVTARSSRAASANFSASKRSCAW